MWYMSPSVEKGQDVSAGSVIGIMTDRAAVSPGMTNHVRVQLYKNGRLEDPARYFC